MDSLGWNTSSIYIGSLTTGNCAPFFLPCDPILRVITIVTYFKGLVRILGKTCDVYRTVPSIQHLQYVLAAIIVYEAFHVYCLIHSFHSHRDVAVRVIII